jgi:tetratricopeptide (TPR) repeat protein
VAVLVVGTVSLSAQTPDRRTWNQAYRDGQSELKAGRYEEAERSFQRAAEADFAPTRRLPNQQMEGTQRDKFYPEYLRAIAILNQKGRAADALKLFERVRNEGLVPKGSAEAKTLDGYVLQARNAVPAPVLTAEASVANPTPVKPAPTPDGPGTPPASPTPTPPPVAAISLAVIERADRAIQAARGDQGKVDTLRDLDVLRQLDSDFRRLDVTARASLAAAVAKFGGGKPGSLADAEEATSLAQQSAKEFQGAQQRAGDVVRQANNALVSATRPYFAGRYAEAKTQLERLNYPGGRFAIQWRLFRSASAYALYVLGRQQNNELRLEAAANIRELRRHAPPGFKPDAAAFSPAFVRFFASVQ